MVTLSSPWKSFITTIVIELLSFISRNLLALLIKRNITFVLLIDVNSIYFLSRLRCTSAWLYPKLIWRITLDKWSRKRTKDVTGSKIIPTKYFQIDYSRVANTRADRLVMQRSSHQSTASVNNYNRFSIFLYTSIIFKCAL